MVRLSSFEAGLVEAFRSALREVEGDAPDEELSKPEIAFLLVARSMILPHVDVNGSLSPMMSAALLLADKITANVNMPGREAAEHSSEILRKTNQKISEILGPEYTLSL